MNSPNQNQPNPEDTRNMMIFFVIAALLFFTYDHFILSPQRAAVKQAQLETQNDNTAAVNLPEHSKGDTVKESALPREEVLAQAPRVRFDNGEIFGSISLLGGRIDDVLFHKYYETLEKKDHVTLLSPDQTPSAHYVDYGWATRNEQFRLPNNDTMWRIRGNDTLGPDSPVTLTWDNGEGLEFTRTVSLDETYMFTVTQSVTNKTGESITLYPYGLAIQTGLPEGFQGTWISHEGPTGFIDSALQNVSYSDLRKGRFKTTSSDTGWAGFSQKYWLTAFVPEQGKTIKYTYKYAGDRKDENNKGRYQIDFVGDAVSIPPGDTAQVTSYLYTGAKNVLTLNDYQDALDIPQFNLAVDFGWLWFLSKPFFYALHYLGAYTGNMGLAIILLTLLIRGSAYPLTNTSYKSFAKMKKVAPQIKDIRENVGDDKQALQQKIMELYQKEGVNPMAGCFPILLQIPIFFALYKTLFVTIEIRHAPFVGWIHDLSAPDPTSLFNLFGLIPWDPPQILMIGVWPCLMLVCMVIQRKLNPPPQDPIQRDMATYFPFVMTFILSKFAAGLVIYWTFSAFIGVIQQMIIMRSMNVPIHLFGEIKDEQELEAQVDQGPAVHPLVDMAEHEVEEALFGEQESEPVKDISPPKPKKKKKTSGKKSSGKKTSGKPKKKS